jgi:predicted transcriptional regulator
MNTSILEVSKILEKQGSKQMIVLDKEFPIGIITLTDIVYKVIAKNRDHKKVTAFEISTKDIFSIEENNKISEAYAYMTVTNRLFCPVISNKVFQGILPFSEVVNEIAKK